MELLFLVYDKKYWELSGNIGIVIHLKYKIGNTTEYFKLQKMSVGSGLNRKVRNIV